MTGVKPRDALQLISCQLDVTRQCGLPRISTSLRKFFAGSAGVECASGSCDLRYETGDQLTKCTSETVLILLLVLNVA